MEILTYCNNLQEQIIGCTYKIGLFFFFLFGRAIVI